LHPADLRVVDEQRTFGRGVKLLAKGGNGNALGGLELLILLAIILSFFGAKRVSELARSLREGARELKKAASEDAGESEEKAVSVDAIVPYVANR